VQQRCQDEKPVEICRGASNYRMDLHIVGTSGGHIAA